MLKTTAQQIYEKCVAGDLGQPIVCSAAIDQGSSAQVRTMFRVPRGQVLLITSVHTQATTNKHGISTTPTNSPGSGFYAIQLTDEAGVAQWVFGFQAFIRNASVFNASTPNAESAEPGNVEVWHPGYAIPVPGGFTIDLQATIGDFGNHGAVHGVLVDEGAAKSMGYNVNPVATKSRHGIAVSRGDGTGGSGESLVAGRPGKHIRILDLHVRVQPATNTINTVELRQSSGGEVFYGISNANVVDSREQVITPADFFLGEGEGIDVLSTVDDQCSVTVQYEYVDPEDVPANAFWGYLEPTRPTPNATALPVLTDARRAEQVVTLYYPKTGAAGTTPGKGHQHLVRGVALSVQKAAGAYENNVQVVEQTLFSLSHGAAASSLALSAIGLSQANVQIIPTLFAGLHSQNVGLVDDRMNVACKPDDGALWWQSIGLGNDGTATAAATSPVAAADADILAWHVTVWGRTIASTFRNLPNRGD